MNVIKKTRYYKILALGASTGGPQALNFLFSNIRLPFTVPIIVVQHIIPGFLSRLIYWLNQTSQLKIKIAENNETLKTGMIYFAPEELQLGVEEKNGLPVAIIKESPMIDYAKPSATYLFNSLAASYPNKSAAGLLTGMGKDGARGLLMMHKQGCYTFIQSKKSSVVFGMSSAALALNAADDVLDLAAIPNHLMELFGGK